MNLTHFSCVSLAVVLGAMMASPLQADSTHRPTLSSEIEAAVRIEPDFFDRGREQFEEEIQRFTERSMNPQSQSDSPLLTIDPSAEFDADVLEQLELQPASPTPNVPLSPISP